MGVLKSLAARYRHSPFFKWVTNSSLAAALVSLAIHLAYTRLTVLFEPEQIYKGSFITQLGESRCELLPDKGSRVCLNTDSEVRYRFNEATRNLEVLRGEISFEVLKDRRSFDVMAGRVLVHDVSTGFIVRRKPHSIRVTVTEGRVRVIAPVDTDLHSHFEQGSVDSAWKTAPELRKFQQTEFNEVTGQWHALPELTERQLQRLTAWEDGRIDLHDRTLRESLDELARYQTLPTFQCSVATGNTRLDGEFVFSDLDGLLEGLDFQFHIHHTTAVSGATTVITLTRSSDKRSEIQPRC